MEKIDKSKLEFYSRMGTMINTLPVIPKDKKGNFNNPYSSMDMLSKTIKPHLEKHKFVVFFRAEVLIQGVDILKTVLVCCLTGYSEIDEQILEKTTTDHKYGSKLTYYKRQGLKKLLCIGGEDDDANESSGVNSKKAGQKPQKKNSSVPFNSKKPSETPQWL